ncbi:hypothetical protein FKM82_014584 [Ascaphus truei]
MHCALVEHRCPRNSNFQLLTSAIFFKYILTILCARIRLRFTAENERGTYETCGCGVFSPHCPLRWRIWLLFDLGKLRLCQNYRAVWLPTTPNPAGEASRE